MRKSDDDIRDSEGFYDAVENLDEDAREDEYAKQEEYGEDYMPPQKGW